MLFSSTARGQHITPYNPNSDKETWALKGKVLPEPAIIQGTAGVNSLIGVEFSFKKRQSIGIDFYFNNWHEYNETYDSAKQEWVDKYAKRIRDKAVFLNYRYYLDFSKWRDKRGIVPYVGVFTRLGYLHSYYDKGYITTTLYQDEIHTSIGLLLGTVFSYAPKRFSGDLNIGVYYKRKDITDSEIENNNNIIYNYTKYNLGIRLGLNLYFWGYRKQKTA